MHGWLVSRPCFKPLTLHGWRVDVPNELPDGNNFVAQLCFRQQGDKRVPQLESLEEIVATLSCRPFQLQYQMPTYKLFWSTSLSCMHVSPSDWVDVTESTLAVADGTESSGSDVEEHESQPKANPTAKKRKTVRSDLREVDDIFSRLISGQSCDIVVQYDLYGLDDNIYIYEYIIYAIYIHIFVCFLFEPLVWFL